MLPIIIKDTLINPYTYMEYKELVAECSEKNSCTGEITKERIEATKINVQRMKRLDKQIVLNNEIIAEVKKIKHEWTWLLLVESWCGDGAQNSPIIYKIAELSDKIELEILLRDENLTLMDKYLTNGSRSIPKLICIDKKTNEEVGTWGPRPQVIQQMVKDYKTQNPTVSHDEFVRNLHLWYAKDKGQSIQNELVDVISKWNSKKYQK